MGILHHLEKSNKLPCEIDNVEKMPISSKVGVWDDKDNLLTSFLRVTIIKEVLSMIVGVETTSQVWSSFKEQQLPMTKEKKYI